MMNDNRVVVTGLGVVSSLGLGHSNFWRNLKSGRKGDGFVRSFDTSQLNVHIGAEVPEAYLDTFITEGIQKVASKCTYFASLAIDQAINDAKVSLQKYKTSLCIGTTASELQSLETLNRMSFIERDLSTEKALTFKVFSTNLIKFLARKYKLSGHHVIFRTACSAGNNAIGYGYDMIKTGEAEIVLAGGSDAFCWVPFIGFSQLRLLSTDKCRPFDKNRNGMVLGEGAGVLLLENFNNAKKRGAKIYAEILGYGMSCDAYHVTKISSEGIYASMNDALKQSKIFENNVDFICAHGTGTINNDLNEARAISKLFRNNRNLVVTSIKSMLGHPLGASSALEAVTCCLVVLKDIIPPTINHLECDPNFSLNVAFNKAQKKIVRIALNNSFAFGGNNVCLVIGKFEDFNQMEAL